MSLVGDRGYAKQIFSAEFEDENGVRNLYVNLIKTELATPLSVGA